jgi:hypothetical protein
VKRSRKTQKKKKEEKKYRRIEAEDEWMKLRRENETIKKEVVKFAPRNRKVANQITEFLIVACALNRLEIAA